MEIYFVLVLQILNLILNFLSPIIISLAYCLKNIKKSSCCGSESIIEAVKP